MALVKSWMRSLGARTPWLLVIAAAVVNLIVLRHSSDREALFARRAGDEVATSVFELRGLDGRGSPSSIEPRGGAVTVVAGFSNACRFCEQSRPVWEQMAASLSGTGVRFIWVNRDSAPMKPQFERARSSDFYLTDVTHRTYVQLGLAKVPRTVVIDPDGRVQETLLGPVDAAAGQRLIQIALATRPTH